MTKYFFDTEFIEDGRTIDLLSIGIVAEDGREFYACNLNSSPDLADEWVRRNVFPHLPVVCSLGDRYVWNQNSPVVYSREWIVRNLLSFIGNDKPEFWAYYADYDWVVLCQLFGRMIDLPKGWPMYCNDVKQLAMMKGNPKLPEQSSAEHHALNDARWTKQAYEFLTTSEAL